jgi:opacity protein-like surface antigen
VITGGVNWAIIPTVIFKAQYASRRLGSQDIDPATLQFTGHKQHENTFSAGISYIF